MMSSKHNQVTLMTFVRSQHKAQNDECGNNFVKMEGGMHDTNHAISDTFLVNFISIQNHHVK
eukprot:11828637-Ditylum_brightwellii.AAC.1